MGNVVTNFYFISDLVDSEESYVEAIKNIVQKQKFDENVSALKKTFETALKIDDMGDEQSFVDSLDQDKSKTFENHKFLQHTCALAAIHVYAHALETKNPHYIVNVRDVIKAHVDEMRPNTMHHHMLVSALVEAKSEYLKAHIAVCENDNPGSRLGDAFNFRMN